MKSITECSRSVFSSAVSKSEDISLSMIHFLLGDILVEYSFCQAAAELLQTIAIHT